MSEKMKKEGWTVSDLFSVADQENKGWISVLDI
jgi:hypothetical protein